MKITVNGVTIGEVLTNRSNTIVELMYAIGYDINDDADLERGYDDGIEGFYIDDIGQYCFDTEAVECF